MYALFQSAATWKILQSNLKVDTENMIMENLTEKLQEIQKTGFFI